VTHLPSRPVSHSQLVPNTMTPSRSTIRRWTTLLIAAVMVIAAVFASADFAVAARSKSADQRFVDGLLARQLFSLAETFCNEQLSREDLPLRRRAELTVELARTHALHALSLPSAARDVAWQAAFDALSAFGDQHQGSPLLFLLRRQEALVHRARGDLLRQEAEVVTTAGPLRQQARASLRKSAGMLTSLLDDLTQALAASVRAVRRDDAALSTDELRNLQEEVRYQLARTRVSQGLTYPAGSADRVNAVDTAKALFSTLAERNDPIDWTARLCKARCDRLLQDSKVALAQLAKIEADAPREIAEQARLERARLLIDGGRAEAALDILQDRAKISRLAAEWDHDYLRALLAARAQGDTKQTTRRLEHTSNDLVRLIEREHGAYWTRRAEALLGRHITSGGGSQDATTLARAAANFFRSDKPDEAIATYDKAAALAQKANDTQQAFDLAYTAATIEHQRRRHSAALDRYRKLAKEQPQHARAAAAHLLAVYNAAQLVRGGPAGALDQYVELLEEHLASWPEAATVDQVRLWLGEVRRARGEWEAAEKLFSAITSASPHYAAAVTSLVRTYHRWLKSLKVDDAQRSRVARRAATYSADRLLDSRGELIEPLDELGRTLLLAWARMRMIFLSEGYDEIEQMLRKTMAATEDASATWRAEAQGLLVLALAGQSRRIEDAAAAAGQLSVQSDHIEGEDLIELALALNVLREQADGSRERALADLQLSLVDQFQKVLAVADPSTQRRLNLARAAALVEAKRFDRAKAEYAKLAKAMPRSRDVQLRYAQALSHPSVANSPEAWQAALAQWRKIERSSKKASGDWFDAKYHQALAHHRMGNTKQALRILKLTAALHPELGGGERKHRFEKLLRECEK